VHLIRGRNASGKESGQILVLTALSLPLILLFVGFAIDFGLGFLTKAELAKACDAASLAVMRNLGRGQTEASAIGNAVFALNYNGSSGLNASVPSLSITYSSDSYGDPIVNITATATIHTFFLRLAGLTTLSASSYSQATRPPVILSLVLDKSGSMNLNGGATALPPSVQDFIGYFIEGTDRLGEVSFSTLANPDVPITQTFQTPINNFVTSMAFGGATFAQGGLLDAQTQVTGVSSPPPNAVETVVFFTDGWANTNQNTLGGSLVNYGGCSQVEYNIGWCAAVFCMNPTTGATISYTSGTSGSCNGSSTFPAQDPSLTNPAAMNLTNIGDEATYRAVQLADQMRTQGITVYSIGLGSEINTTYLQELANDPASPTYNASEPTGIAVFAPTASDLDAAFQKIASKILLRLTQ
jgi:Flp pilus assembly protein TadG